MQSDLIRRIRHGFIANLYGQAVVVLIQLAGLPVLLYYWGNELYGEWLILSAITTYLSMSDLGFSISAANDMTARAARGDFAGMLSVFQSLIALVFLTAAMGLVLVSVLVTLLPLHKWLNIYQLSPIDVRCILWLLAAEILIKLPDGVNHAGFRANGDYALHTSIYFSSLLIQQASVWLIAANGFGPVAAAAAIFLLRCIITPSCAWYLVFRHRYLTFGIKYAQLRTLKMLVRPALANTAMPLAQAINIQGMVLVVGMTLGPATVVVFSTLRTLTRLATQAVLSVSHALEPELARAWGLDDQRLLLRLYVRGFVFAFWLALGQTAALYFLGNWILARWTGERVQMDHLLFLWLLASAFASVLWYSGLNLLKAVNLHLHAAIWFVMMALMAILLAALLIHMTGRLSDAGLALLVMDSLMAVYLSIVTSRLIKLSFSRLLAATINLSDLN